ncbi:ribonuclease T2 family protein [Pannonibacter tanglangensis]|uniref:Ribonuclease T n=1 Tax=Pannonibacter tanglangensis TaxID=2750084 RepID=A0ABW9ZEM5_9HYPH|nr:ribonuclease T2 [Pannonibacter sp. XCT-34]NBN63295.1 ribonuclease T [Pannonibacter sp. XCT-34]
MRLSVSDVRQAIHGCLSALLVLLGLALLPATTARADDDEAGDFDFYVLALSWSPTYCATAGARADPQQCRAARPFRFIVHGLWPQHERGWPDFCALPRENQPSREIVEGLFDIMPSRGLIQHQWRKHGSCTGLSAAAYFDLTRAAFEKITIPAAFQNLRNGGRIGPDAVETAFRMSNPGLRDNAIATTCDAGKLKEVRICFDKELNFRSCPAVDRADCRARVVEVPAP